MKIAYEKHPVTPERKRELNQAGYKIMDARFQPSSEQIQPKSEPITADSIDKMKKRDVSELLAAHGVTEKMKVAEMRPLLKEIMFIGNAE